MKFAHYFYVNLLNLIEFHKYLTIFKGKAPFLKLKIFLLMGESNTVVVPIHCIGTYNNIALFH